MLLGDDLLKFAEVLKIARRCRRIIVTNDPFRVRSTHLPDFPWALPTATLPAPFQGARGCLRQRLQKLFVDKSEEECSTKVGTSTEYMGRHSKD